MLARTFFLIGLVLLVTGCSHHHKNMVLVPVKNSQQTRSLPAFSRVFVKGRLNVDLHTGYSRPHIVLHGDPHDLEHVVAGVVDGALFVTLDKRYPNYGSVRVEIDASSLNVFNYEGRGDITGSRLYTKALDLTINNMGTTKLQGQIGLNKLDVSGSGYTEILGINSAALNIKLTGQAKVRLAGRINLTSVDLSKESWLSVFWVKGKLIKIRSRNDSLVQLAGVVEKLDVELWGTAHFRGRYLRADRAFVKTHDKSIAELSAIKRQHTLAKDSSDIRFYNLPTMKADFMADEGAVLDMRDLGDLDVEEYTEYNK